jgi:hypothetical protein
MSRLTTQQRWKLWALENAKTDELIKSSIRSRWTLPNWDITFPWWREPATVRILFYADGRITFENGLFRGMSYVKTLLQSRPYFYVDFEITTAHRNGGRTGASIPGPIKLDDPKLDILNKFDEIWFFGFSENPRLTEGELGLLDTFMKSPYFGGVLVTGDHANRGKGIAGNIPRAGKMRRYPAPRAQRPIWNNSLVEGSDPNRTFDPQDQSDDVPQIIDYKLFPVMSLPGFKPVYRPHPVLCGPSGPIDVLPDHQHEGEAIAPADSDDEWPTKEGYREYPLVIAEARTKEPGSGNREFGILSAYNGHNVDVGRIVADASWHHWLNVNLTGIPGSEFYRGFDASPDGRKALKKIDSFFLNCGAWLAPPALQREMRISAWWSILWTDQIAELSPDDSLMDLGEQALAALSAYASVCAASDWVFGSVSSTDQLGKSKLVQVSESFSELNISLEQYLAGSILKVLMDQLGPSNQKLEFPVEPPSDKRLEDFINDGVLQALLGVE